jgi:hypothetical protein
MSLGDVMPTLQLYVADSIKLSDASYEGNVNITAGGNTFIGSIRFFPIILGQLILIVAYTNATTLTGTGSYTFNVTSYISWTNNKVFTNFPNTQIIVFTGSTSKFRGVATSMNSLNFGSGIVKFNVGSTWVNTDDGQGFAVAFCRP